MSDDFREIGLLGELIPEPEPTPFEYAAQAAADETADLQPEAEVSDELAA